MDFIDGASFKRRTLIFGHSPLSFFHPDFMHAKKELFQQLTANDKTSAALSSFLSSPTELT
jgi:hypothetical protein